MGLDMYLKAKKWTPAYDHSTDAEKAFYKELVERTGIADHAYRVGSRSVEVAITVATWRKANHVHKWFVDNVQNGVDECQDAYVSKEKMQELVDLCKKVLNTVECVEGDVNVGRRYNADGSMEQLTKKGKVVCQTGIAKELMPTAEGFFFGQTDYDEYYLRDLQDTIDMIEPLLLDEKLKGWEFEYQSSW